MLSIEIRDLDILKTPTAIVPIQASQALREAAIGTCVAGVRPALIPSKRDGKLI